MKSNSDHLANAASSRVQGYTPGPWAQDKYGDVVTRSGAMLVAEGVALGGRSTEETRANARLIAAAPDLLAELQNIANADTSKWDDPSDFKAWAQNRARAAVAKAIGAKP